MKNIFFIFLLILLATVTNGQTINRAIDVKFTYNSPVFNFNDTYNGGIGINVGILYPFYDNMQFSLNSGYAKWGFDNTAFNLKNTDARYTNFDITAPITMIPITFGIKYYASNSKVQPYFSAELGFFYYSQKTSGSYTYVAKPGVNGEIVTLPVFTDSGFRTMANAGAGVTTPLNKDWSLDFQVKMNILLNAQSTGGSHNGGSVEGTSSTFYFLSIAGGINYYFE